MLHSYRHLWTYYAAVKEDITTLLSLSLFEGMTLFPFNNFLLYFPVPPLHLSLSLSPFLSLCLLYTSKSMEAPAEPTPYQLVQMISGLPPECPSVYHAAINASSARRKSTVCKTLHTSKFTRSCILVHMLTLTRMKLTMHVLWKE